MSIAPVGYVPHDKDGLCCGGHDVRRPHVNGHQRDDHHGGEPCVGGGEQHDHLDVLRRKLADAVYAWAAAGSGWEQAGRQAGGSSSAAPAAVL